MLADKISELMVALDNHYSKLSNQLNVIQLLFLETQYVKGRPLLSPATLKTMAITYSIGATHLAPSQEIREAFGSLPLANPKFQSCFLFPSAPPVKVGWFTPWKAEVILPKELIAKVELEKLQAFLYCPSQKEVGHHKYWFEKEQAADSFTHQLNSILAIYHEEGQIHLNAMQPAVSIFEHAIEEWRGSVDHSDKITQNNDSLYDLSFAPHDEKSCWQAWQEVVKTIHHKEFRHRRALLALYREKLEQAFFQGLNLEENICSAYLSNFRAQAFDKIPQPKNQKGGRWEQAEIPDCYAASRIIRYIAHHFIDNPEVKAWGEAALALWVMVWAAQEAPEMITKEKVLSIRTDELNTLEATINIEGIIIEISDYLAVLLGCLISRSSGKRDQLIFKNLNSKSFERILQQASIAVLGAEETPIMPSAFLTSFHIYPNIRMPSVQRRAMQKGRQILDLSATISQTVPQ